MKKLFYFIAIVLTTIACGKKITCPPFSDDEITQLIYRTNDTVKFVNSNNDTLVLVTQNIIKSEAYAVKCRDLYGICNCESNASISASSNLYQSTFSLIKLTKYNNSEAKIYKFQFWDYQFEIDFADFENNINFIENLKLFDTLSINGKKFNKVFCFTNPNPSSSKVKKVYVNNQFGVLQIEEQQNSNIWKILSKK